jgi:TRAP-type C4-dicarboxylate transport system substrate-binding protein
MIGRWCFSALATVALFVAPAVAAEYRMLTSWDKSNPAIPVLAEPFAKNVEKASNGSIKLVLNGPETVPPFEQLQPVVAGAFQLLFTHGIYHYGTTGIAVGLDALTGTIEERRASGIFEALDKYYQKLGLKLIAAPISARDGYGLVLKAPVGADGDLRARKIRGTPSYHAVIRSLGGAPVVLPGGEVYSALEKGVVDGAAWPVVGLIGMRWYEVAKYLVQPTYGVNHYLFLANLGTWNRLSEPDKKTLLDEGRRLEEVWYKEYGNMAAAEIRELLAKGMTVTKLGTSQEKLNEVWAEGQWALAEKKSPTEAKELRALAKSKGLTN